VITRWLGLVPYEDALVAQRAHRAALIAGQAGEELWLLEHPPVITTGRRVVPGLEREALRARGYDLVATERGGLATCHEPGQLVAYVFMDVRGLGVRRAVSALEEAVIGWLVRTGVEAGLREGHPGVWVGREKVCAIGLHIREGRTMHGIALNLTNDLRGFSLITPCGIVDGGVTSVARLLGHAPTPLAAAPSLGEAIVHSLLDARGGSVNMRGPEGT
jgi:lipoate-protein ligase B